MRTDARPRPSPNASSMSDLPSRRSPVPASMMIGNSPRGRISTHDVLPPYRHVACPGTGIEPRTPQNRTFMRRADALRRSYHARKPRRLEALARIEQDRHRAVVDQLDRHVRCELSRLDTRDAGGPDRQERLLVERPGRRGLESADERRA